MRALWYGTPPHIVGTFVGSIARLCTLRTLHLWMMPVGNEQYTGVKSYIRRWAFFYLSSCVALAAAYPMDVAFTCQAADMRTPRRFRSTFRFLKFSVKEHGIWSLYRGFPLCLATAAPFILVSTSVHDAMAARFLRRMGQAPALVDYRAIQPGVQPNPSVHLYPWNLFVGCVSGFVAQSVTYPLDTLRRRWQWTCTELGNRPENLRTCFQRIAAEGSWRSLYNGYWVSAIKLAPQFGVLSCVYLQIHTSGHVV